MLEESKNAFKKSLMERVIFETTVQYEPLHESMLSDLSRNLSVGGLYLRTNFRFEIDETLMLSFALPSPKQDISISCKARVAWTNYEANRLKPDYPAGVGLQFLSLSPEAFTTLSQFIDAYDEDKKMNVLCAWCGCFLGMRRGPFGTTSHGLCSQCRKKLEPAN